MTASARICMACGAESPPAARFCCRCGAPHDGAALRSLTVATPLVQQWRSLRADLTRKEVRRLLGEPLRVEPPDAPGTASEVERWVYRYAPPALSVSRVEEIRSPGIEGLVIFARDGRLISWIEPDWSALRSK